MYAETSHQAHEASALAYANQVAAQLDIFSQTLPPLSGRPTSRVLTRREYAISQVLNEVDVWDALEQTARAPQALGTVIGAIDRLEQADGTGSRFVGLVSTVMERTPYLITGLGGLSRDSNRALFSLLERAIGEGIAQSQTPTQLVSLVETLGSYQLLTHGHRPRRPLALVDKLRADPEYGLTMLDVFADRLRNLSTPDSRLWRARDFQRTLFERLGYDPKLTKAFVRSLEERVDLVNPRTSRPLSLSEGGGLDVETWVWCIARFVNRMQRFGPEGVRELRDVFGLVCIDRYSEDRLAQNLRIAEAWRQGKKPPLGKDVTMLASNIYSDVDNLAAGAVEVYDNGDPNMVVTEFGSHVDLYKRFIKLKRMGIPPSVAILIGHSNEGHFGIGGLNSADIGYVRPEGAFDEHYIDVRQTQVGTLFYECMAPHSQTGERHVVFHTCDTGSEVEGTTLLEVVADLTVPEARVAVSGAAGWVAARRVPRGVEFLNVPPPPLGEKERRHIPVVTRTARKNSAGRVTLTATTRIPAVR